MQLPTGPVPTSLSAELIFGGVSAAPVTFNASDLSDYEPDETLHFVLEGSTDIANELATGHYDYTVVFKAGFAGGDTWTRTVVGGTEIVNLTNNSVGTSEYGVGWSIDGFDRLVPGDGTACRRSPTPGLPPTPEEQGLPTDSGFALIRGDNTSAWYTATPRSISIVRPSDRRSISRISAAGNWQPHRPETGSSTLTRRSLSLR